MSDARQRALSAHGVVPLAENAEQDGSLGTVRRWRKIAGRTDDLRCMIEPIRASSEVALSQPTVRSVFRIHFAYDPSLDSVVNRLLVTDHPSLRGRVLRLTGEPSDQAGRGWMFQVFAEYRREDQQEPVGEPV